MQGLGKEYTREPAPICKAWGINTYIIKAFSLMFLIHDFPPFDLSKTKAIGL